MGMNITINGLELGIGTDFDLESAIEGLDIPPIRTSQMNYSGRDGGQVNGQFYSPRLITIPGHIIGSTCEEHDTLRTTLAAALPIREDLEVTIETFSGDQYITTVRLLSFKMPITNPKASRYKIDLVAADPFFYTGEEQSVIIPRNVGGGFILPVILPIVFDAGTSPTVVTNSGTVAVYPVITITGSAVNPQITNTDTQETVQVNVTMTGSDVLIIDLKNRTITLNGGSVIGYRTSDSSWFDLEPGINRFRYDTDSGSDTGVCVMSWRTAAASL